ncbi:MAG TPA: hypothetical protein VGP82_09765 [Ktedonobacterales bacterium]|jgi:uncharacterized membrane protein (DUF485 family)|nr:hypothetical protein [Ktedonobacterales bacterium]
MESSSAKPQLSSASFARFGGYAALFAAVGSLLYSVAFVILKNVVVYSIALAVGGLVITAILTAVYFRVRETDIAFALWALLIGVVAALGSAAHGMYDLANALTPNLVASAQNAPSQIDARGFLTFGLSGVALFIFSLLIARGGRLPRGLGYLGIVLGLLLVEIFLARLIVIDTTTTLGLATIVGPAAIAGLILNPLFNIWLGVSLLRGARS